MATNFDQHGQISQRPDLLAGIVGSAMDAIIAMDDAERIVLFNSAAERIFVCPANEAIGKSIESFIPQRFRPEHSAHVRRFAESGVTNRTLSGLGTLWGLRATGEEFPIEASISKVESGGQKFLTVVVRDITERHRAEKAARESEQRFRLVANTAPVLIWMSGTDRLCTYFNKPWLDFTGRSMKQELGNGWAEGVHSDDLQRCIQTYSQAFDRRENFRLEYRLRRHDGEYRWVLDIGVPRFNHDGSFAGYIGIGVDITERKCAERELAQSNERLNLTLEVGRIGGWEWDVKTSQTFWFGQNYALLGVQPDESASERVFWNQVHPEDRWWLRESVERALQDRLQSAVAEFRVVWRDQTVHWLRSEARYFYGEDGQPERMLGISTDITERKIAEEALRKNEERFRLAARSGKMFAYEWDVATDLIVRSGDIANVLGATGETSLTRQQLLARIHPDDRALFNASVTERTPEHPDVQISYRLLRPDGSVVWLEKTAHAFFDERGRMLRMIGMVADITERKLTEDKLREYERAVELSEEAIALVDREYRFVIANRKYLRLRKMSKEQVVGHFVSEVLNKEVFENVVKEKLDECFQGKVVRYEMKYTYPELGERDVLVSYFPIEGANGVDRVASIMQDITDRKRLERVLTDMSRKLIEAQEQERARIAREFHDDIGQRLAMISVELERLRDIAPEAQSPVQKLRKELGQISEDVQALSHELHDSKLEYLGLVAATRCWCKEFAERQRIDIDFKSNVQSVLPVEAGLTLLRVLQEALHNATKHSGVKRVEVQLSERSGQVHLSIADKGVGFDVETAMKGRGLGLTSMRQRVRLVDGTIAIESKPMNGTIIHVWVPLVPEPKSQRAAV